MRLVLIFLLALGLRTGLAAFRYTTDTANLDNGDYALYAIGADHFQANHNFDNSLFLVRPPVYPILIAALGGDNLPVLAADAFMGALIAPVTYFVALQLGVGVAASLIAALIVALDPASIAYSTFLGPEALANLLIALAALALLRMVKVERGAQSLLWGGAAGVALALASLTRPASYLLWIPLGIWLIARRRRDWLAIALFVAINLITLAGWTIHNGSVFGNPTFSTTGPYTMLYYHAAAVERFASGKSPDEVFTEINRRVETLLDHDATNVDQGTRYGYLAATVDIQNAETSVALDIFRAHPLLTLATFPLGFVRMYGYTQTLPRWLSLIDIPFNGALLLGTLVGLWLALRRKSWTLFWFVLIVCAYFTTGILLVKTSGLDTRELSMLTPFMAAACAYAFVWARERWQARQVALKG